MKVRLPTDSTRRDFSSPSLRSSPSLHRSSLLINRLWSPWYSSGILIYETIFRTHVCPMKSFVISKYAKIGLKKNVIQKLQCWWNKQKLRDFKPRRDFSGGIKNFVLINRITDQFCKAKVCVEREFIYGWSRIKQENSLVCEIYRAFDKSNQRMVCFQPGAVRMENISCVLCTYSVRCELGLNEPAEMPSSTLSLTRLLSRNPKRDLEKKK